MKVEIWNFKCHDHVELVFGEGDVTLLTGANGSGKTSVGLAVAWCLYGKIIHVDPQAHGRTKTKVRLTFAGPWVRCRLKAAGLEITRTRNPSTLTFALSGPARNETLSGKEAQARIDDSFGPEIVWSAASYLEQKCRCSFLGLGLERLRVLTWLCFQDQNPENVATKLDAVIKDETRAYQAALAKYEAQKDLYTGLIAKLSVTVDETTAVPGEDAQLEENQEAALAAGARVLEELAREKAAAQLVASKIEALDAEINTLEEQVTPAAGKGSEGDELAQITSSAAQLAVRLRKNEARRAQLDEILAALRDHGSGPAWDGPEPTWDSVAALRRAFEAQDAAVKMINVVLGRRVTVNMLKSADAVAELTNAVNARLSRLTRCLDAQEQLGLQSRKGELEGQVDPTTLAVNEAEQLVKAKKLALRELKRRCAVLSCPRCQSSLVLTGGKLALSDVRAPTSQELATAEAEVGSAVVSWEAAVRQEKIRVELAACSEALAGLPALAADLPLLTEADAKRLRHEKRCLEGIELRATPAVTPEATAARLRWLEREKAIRSTWAVAGGQGALPSPEHLEHLRAEAAAAIDDDSGELSRLRGREAELLRQLQVAKRLGELRVKLGELRQQRSDRDFDTEIAGRRSEMEALKARTDHAKLVGLGRDTFSKLEQLDAALAEAEKRYSGLVCLKQVVSKLWALTLEMTLRDVNARTAEILSGLFVDPIEVAFALAGEKTTTQIELKIAYRGREYDNAGSLSGGEGDRISLALVLALAYVLQTPVLILDESLSFMDGETREASMKVLKAFAVTLGASVLSIQQDCGSVSYDQVIDLDSGARTTPQLGQ